MMHKIKEYLSSKENDSYTHLDKIIKMHIDGEIENELSKYELHDIEIFTRIKKRLGNTLQLNFKYYNLVCTIDFTDERYTYVIYPIGASFEEIENQFINCEYANDFSINKLIFLIFNFMKENSNLRDNTKLKNMQKKYKTIANIFLLIPWVVIVPVSVYVFITKASIQLNQWFLLIIIIPLVLWFIFDVKSKGSK